MNYYPHHIGDFNNATRHLTRIERCVYRELIELYYDTEEPLINDISYLCRRILATSEQESAAVEQVLTEFFILDNNEEFFVNARCEKVIKEYQSNKKNKSKAGKASARSRKALKLKEKEGLTPVEQPLSTRGTNEQLTKNQNQEPKPITIFKEKEKAKRFSPPTPEEAGMYFLERGHHSAMQEAENFIDFYSAKGWMIGKNKMKDWKAAVRNWMKNDKNFGEGNAKSSGRDRTSTYDIENTDW